MKSWLAAVEQYCCLSHLGNVSLRNWDLSLALRREMEEGWWSLSSYIQTVAHAFFSTLSPLIRSKCSLKGGIICSLLQMHYGHTLTGHFIRYTLLVPGWTPFAFRTALILHGIDSTRCWKHSSEILVHIDMICHLHIHDAYLLFHHIPKVLYWIEIWWLWRPFE